MNNKEKHLESYIEHYDPDFRYIHRKLIEKDLETVQKRLDNGQKRRIVGGRKDG